MKSKAIWPKHRDSSRELSGWRLRAVLRSLLHLGSTSLQGSLLPLSKAALASSRRRANRTVVAATAAALAG